eukprot:2626-Heterococcus_DN1.PRE.1
MRLYNSAELIVHIAVALSYIYLQQTPGSLNQTVEFGAIDIPIAVTVGENFVCVLLDNGTVKCFGSNDSGQLGQGKAVTELGGTLSTIPSKLNAINPHVSITTNKSVLHSNMYSDGDIIIHMMYITSNNFILSAIDCDIAVIVDKLQHSASMWTYWLSPYATLTGHP